MHPHRWLLAVPLLLPVLALAGRRDAARESVEEEVRDDRGLAASAAEIPALSKLLEKAQWEPTPELSGAFRAGHIFEQTELGHRPLATDCIEATPAENPYTAADVITSLQAGVQVGALAARGEVTGEVVKKIKFGTPVQSSLPRLDLVLTEACTAKLQRLPRAALERSYVIQEVLRAQISEQTCGRVDASGRIVGLGAADAELQRACSQASLEPVAVGYRTVPLVSLMALGAAAPSPSTPLPVPPSTPASSSASVDFGGMGSVDVDARLKAQACEQAAQREGAAARQARLDAAALEVQAQASAAWQGMEGDLRKCTRLPRADRTDCIAMADKWLGAARTMTVRLDAGVETVQTDCGARQPAFAAASQTVSAREVAAAEALLVKLKAADATVASSGGVVGVVTLGPAVVPSSSVTPGKAGISWVSLGRFEISKTEVTVAQYRACVQDGFCSEPGTGSGCNWGLAGRDNHPINCVDWNQASLFARWAGGRLPTGEEWTYAATSGGQTGLYPWGDKPATCDRAIMSDGGRGCGEGRTWPVCSRPAGNSLQGVCDLAGNVWEWTADSVGASFRVRRGGSWSSSESYLRVSHHSKRGLLYSDFYLGFRLAR